MIRLILAALTIVSLAANAATITDGTWTPARTEAGAIDPSDVATLPENEWVAVNGVTYSGLKTAIVDAFNAAHGTNIGWSGGISVTVGDYIYQAINAWSSGYFDSNRNQICNAATGGHTAGSVTGTWCWGVESGKWEITEAPDDPNNPRWCDAYRGTYSATNYPRSCLTEAGWTQEEIDAYPFDDRLPNGEKPTGKPTARHWYGTQAYDPVTDRVFGARKGLWTQDKATNRWHVVAPLKDGVPADIKTLAAAIYHPIKDKVCGILPLADGDYYGWRCIDPETGETSGFPGMIGANCMARGCTLRWIPGTNQAIAYSASEDSKGEIYSIYDFVLKKYLAANKPVTGDVFRYDYRNEIPAMTYVPDWLGEDGERGLWVRINTHLIDGTKCVWSIFNHRTGAQWQYKPNNKPTCSPFVGNKLAYTHIGSTPMLVLMSANSDTDKSVWYLRVGDRAPLYPGDSEPVPNIRTDINSQIAAGSVEAGDYAGDALVRNNDGGDIDFHGATIHGDSGPYQGVVNVVGGPLGVTLRNFVLPGGSGNAAIWGEPGPNGEPLSMLLDHVTMTGYNNGIMTPTATPGGELYLYDVTIADGPYNATYWGRRHNIYAGLFDWFESDGLKSLGHDGAGHLLKSRAKVTIVRNSVLDGKQSRHSRIADISCGGLVVFDGVTATQSPNSDNVDLLAIGAEQDTEDNCVGNKPATSTLVLRNTSWTANKAGALFMNPAFTSQYPVTIICNGTNTFTGVEPPVCDSTEEFGVPPRPTSGLADKFTALAGDGGGSVIDPPPPPPDDPPTWTLGEPCIVATRSIAYLYDENGEQLPVQASLSGLEMVEKLSGAPDGKYTMPVEFTFDVSCGR